MSGQTQTADGKKPKILKIISPKFLLIESNAGAEDLARSTVTVRNAGSTVLYFTWSRVARGENVVSRNGNVGPASGINNDSSDDIGMGNPNVDKGLAVGGGAGEAPELGLSDGGAAAATRHAALQAPDPRFFCHQVRIVHLRVASSMFWL